jgi:dienelactone hydrolase
LWVPLVRLCDPLYRTPFDSTPPGFCWGGLAGFKIASKNLEGLLDCVAIAHPGTPSDEDVCNLGIPTQIIASEFDFTFTPERKAFCNEQIPKLGIDFVYNHFPGVSHGFGTRANPAKEVEKKAMERAVDSVVYWFLTYSQK